MKKGILVTTALTLALTAGAQSAERQVLGSAGTGFDGAGIQADYTVGEAITVTGTTGSFTLTQGFHQNTAGTSAIKEESFTVSFALYPNPAKDQVTLSLNSTRSFDLKISLSTGSGQTVHVDKSAEKAGPAYTRTIPLHGLASGIYFLNLYDGMNTLLQSIRFVKQ